VHSLAEYVEHSAVDADTVASAVEAAAVWGAVVLALLGNSPGIMSHDTVTEVLFKATI